MRFHDSSKKGDSKISPKLSLILQLSGIVIALFALLIPTYLSIRGNIRKELEVRYLAQLSIVNPQATDEGDLEVRYKGDRILNLSKISGKIINSGNVPITASDIEEPIQFSISKGKILGARIIRTIPTGIRATASIDSSICLVRPGLLNPGDVVEFELLMDSNTNLPEVSFRIRGVPEPVVTHASDRVEVSSITIIKLAKPIQVGLLSIVSLLPIVFIVLLIVMFKEMFREFGAFSLSKVKSRVTEVLAAERSRGRVLFNLEREKEKLRNFATQEGRRNTTVNESGIEALKSIASSLYYKLPKSLDKEVKLLVQNIHINEKTDNWNKLVDQVEKRINSDVFDAYKYTLIRRLRLIDKTELVAVLLGIILLYASVMIIGGSWRLFLAV